MFNLVIWVLFLECFLIVSFCSISASLLQSHLSLTSISFLSTNFRGNKRYENSSSGGGGYSSNVNNVNIWAPSSGGGGSGSSHLGTSGGGGGGGNAMKSYGNNGISSNMHSNNSWQKSTAVDDNSWRPVQAQGRFDRGYNDRSSGYQGNSGTTAGGMYGGSRPTQDRYGGQVSRY